TQLVLDLGSSAVTYTVDDIALVEGSSPMASTCHVGPPNLLLDGDLELGAVDEFTNWNKMNGGAYMTATTATEEVYGGSRALQAVSAGGNAWSVQLGSDAVTTVIGTSYTASMWIKGDVADGIVRFSTAGDGAAQYQGDQTIGTEWQQISWTFEANGLSTQLVLDLGSSAATYVVDDI